MLGGTNPPLIPAERFKNPRLFASREDMLRALVTREIQCICEVGVAYGDFSEFLISTFKPELFAALDLFDMHNDEMAWGRPTIETFQGQTHLEFYENKMKGKVKEIIIKKGLSNDTLQELEDDAFDLIYVDAAHDYESAKKDGALRARLEF